MVSTTKRRRLDKDRKKKLRANVGIAMKECRTARARSTRQTNQRFYLQERHRQTDRNDIEQQQDHQTHNIQLTRCRHLTVMTSDINEDGSDTISSENVFARQNIQLRSYRIKIAGPCEYCGALLLEQERISARGYKLVTPCCGNGKVVFLTMIY
jgi:hypothetical protein